MKSGRQFEKPPFSLAAYVPALVMLMAALLLLAWAFLQPSLSPDQRILANLFYSIVLGSMGFFWVELSFDSQEG